MKNIKELLGEMSHLKIKIDELNSLSQYHKYGDFSCLEINENDPEELLLQMELSSIMEKLNDVLWSITYLKKPVLQEGHLFLNSEGYYELKGKYGRIYQSGYTIEFLDPYENSWTLSRIEHNGLDYYIVGYSEISLAGLKVRIRN